MRLLPSCKCFLKIKLMTTEILMSTLSQYVIQQRAGLKQQKTGINIRRYCKTSGPNMVLSLPTPIKRCVSDNGNESLVKSSKNAYNPMG
jgi:hypothetical protein